MRDDDLSDFTGNYRDPTFGLLTLWEYVQQTLDPRRPEIVDRSVGTVELCGPMLQRGCLKEDWVCRACYTHQQGGGRLFL